MLSLPTIDFIPGWLYLLLFDIIILLTVMMAVVQAASGNIYHWNASLGTQVYGKLLIFFIILYIGLRPTHSAAEYPYFVDTYNYVGMFEMVKLNMGTSWFLDIDFDAEWFWGVIVAFCAAFADVHTEFLIAATFYVGCSSRFCTRTFGPHWFVPFVMICSSFTFFSYGVNGIRNGMAASMIILALSYRNNLKMAIILSILAMGVHKSMALTIASAILAWKITNPKIYIAGWLTCVAIAAAMGGTVANIVSGFDFFDDRLSGYTDQKADIAYYAGFRLDFLLYSSLPIISGAYFIFAKDYKNQVFIWIYNVYITSNAFWVLMMYASFSNRFAQLSWFIMPIVLMYPWFKKRFWVNQETKLATFILVCYAYTFYEQFIRSNLS